MIFYIKINAAVITKMLEFINNIQYSLPCLHHPLIHICLDMVLI